MTQIYDRLKAGLAAIRAQQGIPDSIFLPANEIQDLARQAAGQAPAYFCEPRRSTFAGVALFEDRALFAEPRIDWHKPKGTFQTLVV